MPEKETLFLTIQQALEAVRVDLNQYEPQIMLVCQILRVLSGGRIVAKREPGRDGAWVGEAGRQNMRWIDGPELVRYACETLKAADPDAGITASICARVFHTRAYPDRDTGRGQSGIRLETGMEDYLCRQCGQCCRTLDYHGELTAEDMNRWRRAARNDILEWVTVIEREDREPAYRIWTYPGTDRPAEVCPFLQKVPSTDRWDCTIHPVRPDICRQYPFSRKHALMTGCIGFSQYLNLA